MPEPDQDQDNQLTGDELSELHGLASQLQAVGDPRADRVWKVIDAQTDRDADRVPGFRVTRSPLKVTSWLEDLENTLWGDQPGVGQKQGAIETGDSGNDDGAAAQAPGDDQGTQQPVEVEGGTPAAPDDASSDDSASVQEMFGGKFAAQNGSTSDQTAAGSGDDRQQPQILAQNAVGPRVATRPAGGQGGQQPQGQTTPQKTVPPGGTKQVNGDQKMAELWRQSREQHPGVEILTFDPVGIGRSSFGHQAISIDGHVYSFTHEGTWHEDPTNKYLGDNNFRNATGQVLNLTPEEAEGVRQSIEADKTVAQKWTATNNCTTKVRDMLEQGTHRPFWPLSHTIQFAPADFSHMLDFIGYVSQTKHYPKAK